MNTEHAVLVVTDTGDVAIAREYPFAYQLFLESSLSDFIPFMINAGFTLDNLTIGDGSLYYNFYRPAVPAMTGHKLVALALLQPELFSGAAS